MISIASVSLAAAAADAIGSIQDLSLEKPHEGRPLTVHAPLIIIATLNDLALAMLDQPLPYSPRQGGEERRPLLEKSAMRLQR